MVVIADIFNEPVARLKEKQEDTGEFKTYARMRNGESFYIGECPFVTALIAWLLSDVKDEGCRLIVRKALDYLESLDDTGRRVYKFWHNKPFGTDYPDLPYDLDDTAIVNTALVLSGRKSVNRNLLENNKDGNGKYYTWIRLSNKTLLFSPSYYRVLFRQMKSFKVFMKTGHNPRMAHYDDSELMVRLNIHVLGTLLGRSKSSMKNERIPFETHEVEKELTSSLHYMHLPVYYLTLAKFQYYTRHLSDSEVLELSTITRNFILTETSKSSLSIADAISLYLSLSLLAQLGEADEDRARQLIESSANRELPYYFCVGNKHFDDYHTYFSSAITEAMKIRLLANIHSLTKSVQS